MPESFKFQIGDIITYHLITFKVINRSPEKYVLKVIKNDTMLADEEEVKVYNMKLIETICTRYLPNYNTIWAKLNN